MKYIVVGALGGTRTVEIEAESVEDAINKADLMPTLCYECSQEFSIDDVTHTTVYAEGWDVLYSNEGSPLSGASTESLLAELKSRGVTVP